MAKWKPIETAPRKIVSRDTTGLGLLEHQYGAYILVWPHSEGVGIARWWQTANSYGGQDGPSHGSFQSVYGRERATHWMPLPKPPSL